MDNLNIGKFTIPKFTPTVESEKSPIIEVMFKLDESGIFLLKHAKAIETYIEIIKTPKTSSTENKSDNDKTTKTDDNNKSDDDNNSSKMLDDNDDNKEKDSDVEMEESKKEKKKITPIVIQSFYVGSLSDELITKFQQEEINMRNADELAFATGEARNSLESYSYDAQSKLQYDFSEWSEFATEEEKTKLLSLVDETLAWLYGEGAEGTKDQFQNKLNELQVIGDPIDLRKNENETRDPAIETLKKAIIYYKAFVDSTDEKYSHISTEERQKVTDKINEIEDWLNKMQEKQNQLPKTAVPVLLTCEIEQRKEKFVTFSNKIVNTPKPKPPPETKKDEEKSKKDEDNTADKMETDDTKSDDKKEEEEENIKPAEEGKIEEVDNSPITPESNDMDVD